MRSLKLLFITTSIGVLILFLSLVMCSHGYANSIGINHMRSPAGNTLGIHGDIEKAINIFAFDIEGQLNQLESVFVGDGVIGVTVDLDYGGITFTDLRIESNLFGEIHSVGDIRGTRDIGAAFVVPIKGVDVSFGYFRKQGNPFQQEYQLIDKYDPESGSETVGDSIEVIGGSSDNLALKAEVTLGIFEISGRGLLQLSGETKRRIHQGIFDVGTGGKLSENITWSIGTKIAADIDSDSEESLDVYIRSTTFDIGYAF